MYKLLQTLTRINSSTSPAALSNSSLLPSPSSLPSLPFKPHSSSSIRPLCDPMLHLLANSCASVKFNMAPTPPYVVICGINLGLCSNIAFEFEFEFELLEVADADGCDSIDRDCCDCCKDDCDGCEPSKVGSSGILMCAETGDPRTIAAPDDGLPGTILSHEPE